MKSVKQHFSDLQRSLAAGQSDILPILERMEAVDVASFLSQNDQYTARIIPLLIQSRKISAVLTELPESKIRLCLAEMNSRQMRQLFDSAPVDDLVYLSGFIEDESRKLKILSESAKSKQIQRFLQYSKDQAGRIMQSPVFALPARTSAEESIEKLRQRSLEEFIFYIYCTDDEGKLTGVVSMRHLATSPAQTPLSQLMKKDVVSVQADMSARETAKIAAHYDFLALPVVDREQKLLGIITMDDIIDIIQEQNTASIYSRAGLQLTEKIHTSPWMSLKNRLPWMFLNLVLAVLASSVISFFEETMKMLIVLASLKNIVASMGGNTAIQTLTVTTRGMAVGDFRFTSFSQALVKELTVGFFMGIIMGLSAGVITYFWKGDMIVSAVIFVSMILNFLMAVFMGSFIPILMSRFKRDPAAGSGVIVTMITDIFGFAAFLGIASLGLKLFS